jgi:hypothetical protein
MRCLARLRLTQKRTDPPAPLVGPIATFGKPTGGQVGSPQVGQIARHRRE